MPFTIRPYRRFLPLAYCSAIWSMITVLLLSVGPAYGEWVLVDKDDRTGMTLYIDPDTIDRRADLVEMWALYDYKTAQTVGRGDSYLSRKVQGQYNCTEKVRRVLGVTEFSGKMGSGNVVYMNSHIGSTEQKWRPVQSDSVSETLWKVACSKA